MALPRHMARDRHTHAITQSGRRNVKSDVVAFRLDDVILLDYDGNKAPQGEIISIRELTDLLGLSDLMQFTEE